MQIQVMVKHPGKPLELITIGNDLKSMQSLVGGYIECVNFDGNKLNMICNEEGKLSGLPYNFDWYSDFVVGTVFFCTHDSEGNFVSITEEQIEYLREVFR
jgi:hypothetical protein